MIRGRYGNTFTRPYVTAHVAISSIGVSGSISFLMDTGADGTVIMPADALRLGVDYTKLHNTAVSYGIGGASADYIEDGLFVVRDEAELKGYAVSYRIPEFRNELLRAPSLLGRNIVNRWKMILDYANDRFDIEVQSADFVTSADRGP